jgi:hypothetical protein
MVSFFETRYISILDIYEAVFLACVYHNLLRIDYFDLYVFHCQLPIFQCFTKDHLFFSMNRVDSLPQCATRKRRGRMTQRSAVGCVGIRSQTPRC